MHTDTTGKTTLLDVKTGQGYSTPERASLDSVCVVGKRNIVTAFSTGVSLFSRIICSVCGYIDGRR